MPQNDQILQILLEQNKDIATIKEKVVNIEVQTTKTNGRVNTLESQVLLIQKDNERHVVITWVNKKWLGWIAIVGLGVWTLGTIVFDKWVSRLFHIN